MFKLLPSVIALVAANLITVYGVWFLDWSFSNILLLYWFESAIVGMTTVIKMIFATPGPGKSNWAKVFLVPFFLVHYGGFMAGHLVFIMLLIMFVETGHNGGEFSEVFNNLLGHLSLVAPAISGLAISHVISLLLNFFGSGEYKTKPVMELFGSPYSRIIVMHLTLLFGMGLTFIVGQHTLVVLLFVALKIAVDLQAHIKEHATQPTGMIIK